MERGQTGAGNGARRALVYCVVPFDLAPKLHDLLRDHFGEDPGVDVVVERRTASDRRSGSDRRATGRPVKPPAKERRRTTGAAGRRVAERRVATAAIETPELPRRARRYADQLTFLQRTEPRDATAADHDATRLALRAQTGEHAAFSELYTRYFDRVYGYMRVALRNAHDAEDATQQVFVNVMQALPTYEPRRPFRAWLFTIARNQALNRLRISGRTEILDPEALDRRAESEADSNGDRPESLELSTLDWISDRDLLLFVERLPEPQRQVLVLRYVLGFTGVEIAQILERSQEDVRMLQSRAHRFLRDRLTKLRAAPPQTARRTRMRIRPRQATVLRARRFSLH